MSKSKNEGLFSVVWKYTVLPEQEEDFEREYGPSGIWAAMFRRSEEYNGSVLLRSAENMPATYLLIDSWNSRSSYETFVSSARQEYDALSARCRGLYRTEECIGAGVVVDPRADS